MIKYCPNPDCNFEEEDYQFDICPMCNKGPLLVRQSEGGNSQTVGADNSRKQASEVSLGMGAAVRGNITSNTSTIDNSTSNVVNNVTNIIKEKSPAELHEENVRLFSRRCRALCNDGLISKESEKELEVMKSELGIEQDEAHAILSEAKRLSKKLRTELTIEGRLRIEKTLNIINGNRKEALISELNGLRQWKQDYNVEELDQLYFQLFAILTPNPYISEFETSDEVSYWQSYWSLVAYQLLGLTSKAEVAHLNAWDSLYPIQNKLLMQSVIALMQCDESTARETFNAVHAGYSKSLVPVVNAIKDLLSMYWDRELATLPATSQFYYDTLFKDFCAMCLRHAEERRKERMAAQKQQEEERERERKEQIRRQQDIDAVNAEAKRVEEQRQLEEERRKKAEAEAEKAKAKAEADRQERERLEAERIARLEEKRRRRTEWWRRNRKWFFIAAIIVAICIVGIKMNKNWREKMKEEEQKAEQLRNDSIADANRKIWFNNQIGAFESFMSKPLNNVDENPKILITGRSILCQLCDTLAKYPELSKNRDFVKEYNSRVDTAVVFVKNASHYYMGIDDSTENEWKNKINQINEMYYNQ